MFWSHEEFRCLEAKCLHQIYLVHFCKDFEGEGDKGKLYSLLSVQEPGSSHSFLALHQGHLHEEVSELLLMQITLGSSLAPFTP